MKVISKLKQRLTPERDMEKRSESISTSGHNHQKAPESLSANDQQITTDQINQQRPINPQPRYRTYTNPQERHHPCYGPEFTSLNPGFAYTPAPAPLNPIISYPSQPIYQGVYPAYTTSTQFDRLATGVSHMSLAPGHMTAYEPTYGHHSVIPSQYSTAHTSHLHHSGTSSADVSESLMRRDNVIDRLKMRIVMLEQQSDNHNSVSSNTSDIQKLNQLEYEANALKTEIGSNMNREEHMNRLEQQLNQKEYEIQENQKNYNRELDQLTQELLKAKSQLADTEGTTGKEKTKCMSLQREVDKLNLQLSERDDYIGKLPTMDEVNAEQVKFNELNVENENLKLRVKELEKKVNRAKEYIRDQNSEKKLSQEKLDQLQMEKEKVLAEFGHYKKATENVGDLMTRCEENASIRAEFELAKKMILKCEEKNKTQETKYETRLKELKEETRMEADVSQALRHDLETKEKTLKSLSNSVKEMTTENQQLQHENLNLREKCQSFELMQSSETTKMLHILFIELSACTNDLDELVNNCIDIYNGKQIEISSLLGYGRKSSEYSNADLATTITQATGLMNTEFIGKRTNEIKHFREKLSGVRKMVSDEYADKLGANMSCATQ